MLSKVSKWRWTVALVTVKWPLRQPHSFCWKCKDLFSSARHFLTVCWEVWTGNKCLRLESADHLVSISAAWMVLNKSSATPTPSTLMRWGWKSDSGASNRSPPTLITLPSGSWGHTESPPPVNGSWTRPATLRDRHWPCTTRPAPSSPAPTSAPARCCTRRSTASPSSSSPSQSPQSGWRRSLAAAAAASFTVLVF